MPSAGNVLPPEARLKGILRTMTADARERVKEDFRSIVTGVAAAMGVEADIDIVESYPCCHNDPALTELLRRSVSKT